MALTLRVSSYILRPLMPPDGADVHRLVNDWSVVRMLSHLPFPYPRDLADQWIASTIERQSAGTAWHFAICEGDTLIGCIGLSVDPSSQTGRIGYWVGRPYWRRGVAGTCVRHVIGWAFDTLPIQTVAADVAGDNAASLTLLDRLGFTQAGTTRVPFLSRGKDPYPVLTYRLDRAAFTALTPAENAQDEVHSPGTVPEAALQHRLSRILLVVAGVLVDREQRILIARRPSGKPMAGLWEFPGGKVEPHESPEQALIRELDEELGVDIGAGCIAPFTFVSENIGTRHLLMPLYLCTRWRGIPAPRENQELAWVRADELGAYPMPAPDRPLIPLLKELFPD